jgi:hypothetical protein
MPALSAQGSSHNLYGLTNGIATAPIEMADHSIAEGTVPSPRTASVLDEASKVKEADDAPPPPQKPPPRKGIFKCCAAPTAVLEDGEKEGPEATAGNRSVGRPEDNLNSSNHSSRLNPSVHLVRPVPPCHAWTLLAHALKVVRCIGVVNVHNVDMAIP